MKIGIIGCGNMGYALLRGVILRGTTNRKNILVSDKDVEKIDSARRNLGVSISSSNTEVIKKCDVIILAVKPQDVDGLLGDFVLPLRGKLIISICAGITTQKLQRHMGRVSVVRVMPNMPGQILQGISAIAPGKYAKAKDKRLAFAIFSCIGEVVEIKEHLMDAVTAISGSGPAYFFYLVERLIATAKELGIPALVAQRLAVKTALGSAMLLNQSGEGPEILRRKVTSKGGTTEAAFRIFKKKGLDKTLTQAFEAAAKRSRQLKTMQG